MQELQMQGYASEIKAMCQTKVSDLSKEELVEMVKSLQKENKGLKEGNKGEFARTLPDKEIKACVLEYVRKFPVGSEFYPSDIALEYNLNGDDVERVMDQMLEDGYFI